MTRAVLVAAGLKVDQFVTNHCNSNIISIFDSTSINNSIMTNLRIATLQRKIKDMKEKLKGKILSKKPEEELESKENISDFVWVGGFQQQTLRPMRSVEPSSKRKLSFSDDDEELSDDTENDSDDDLDAATMELQMAWYKNFNLRFFEDEVVIRSPAKRIRNEQRRTSLHKPSRLTSTPRQQKPVDPAAQIKAFRQFFEPAAVTTAPDFKIYDDYNYPSTPLAVRKSEYLNLVPGNTPAPPLPPRNSQKPKPPMVFRSYKEPELRSQNNFKYFTYPQLSLQKSYSTECLHYSYLL